MKNSLVRFKGRFAPVEKESANVKRKIVKSEHKKGTEEKYAEHKGPVGHQKTDLLTHFGSPRQRRDGKGHRKYLKK